MRYYLIILSFFLITTSQAQDKKTLNITKTNQAPKIDAVLDDPAWENVEIASDFIQFRPEMGVTLPDHKKTIVKMTYDDNAIYISAYLKDKPEDIQKQFTSRDNFGQSDFFLVVLNPNNDAQNDTEFFVFSSGTQADAVANPSNGEDFGWNAVWDSAVKIVDDGWIVEMKIPYRALRFSKDVKTWGLQFHRRFRIDNTQYTWNALDRTKGNIGLYHGELKGIENIEPPTRLALYPFASLIYDNMDSPNYNVGMDIKYGITENFTLDATLIPDFSQAAFDNVTLNLGPFEQTFGEQRQFFKEGVDLFNKGNLFFSRRIGNGPTGDPVLADNEEILDYPNEVKTLNALKVSGRSKNGVGIGFFNAITEVTEATIRNNDTGVNRREVVEPFTNYNIFVVDKQYNGNSSISLVNSNVIRDGRDFRDANVSALVLNHSNKRNTYNIRAQTTLSNINVRGNSQIGGLSSFFRIGKSHGKFRYSFDHRFANEKYNINDLGLNFRNNFNNFGIDVNYRIFEPTKKLNNFFGNFYVNYRRLYKPGTFTGFNLGAFVNGQTKKLMWFNFNINVEPGKQFDFFEPRDFDNKRFFVFQNIGSINGGIETNSNKTLSVEVDGNIFGIYDDKSRDLFGYNIEIEPTIRFNDKFRLSYGIEYQNNMGSRGYVNRVDDDIIFGERDILSIENSISGAYNFDPFNSLTLSLRNFWSTVDYDNQLFTLLEDGSLNKDLGYLSTDIDNPNINFNTWNLDFRYSWQFAPGSFLTALYRNSLFNQTNLSEEDYFGSLGDLFDQPIRHTFSLRLQYFIDYNNVKGIFRSNKKSS